MSCPISWSIIIKRETTKARTIFCFSPSLLCKIAMRHVRSAVESGSVAYSNITAVSHEYFGLTRSRTEGPLPFGLAWATLPPRVRHLHLPEHRLHCMGASLFTVVALAAGRTY